MSFHHSAFNVHRPAVGPERADINVGMNAPDFTLLEADGGTTQLSGIRSKPVLLIFFRRDW